MEVLPLSLLAVSTSVVVIGLISHCSLFPSFWLVSLVSSNLLRVSYLSTLPSIHLGRLRPKIPKSRRSDLHRGASWEEGAKGQGGKGRRDHKPKTPARFHAKKGPAGRRLCYVTSRPACGFQIYDGEAGPLPPDST